MSDLDLVIAGGTVVTAADSYAADIGIKDGRIAQIGTGLSGAERIDATGLLVLPGGIDAHVHLDQPTSDGTTMADDFASGTRSAAAGATPPFYPSRCRSRASPCAPASRTIAARRKATATPTSPST